jgi:hypothetical protein
MHESKRVEEIREMLTSRYWGYDNIELIIPIVAALIDNYNIEKIAPIITELLSDDPLVNRITEIYEKGTTLWFALQENK